MVPSPVRAASTMGRPRRSARSIIITLASRGTISPPAASTTSSRSEAGSTIRPGSIVRPSSSAAWSGASGARNPYAGGGKSAGSCPVSRATTVVSPPGSSSSPLCTGFQ